MRLWPRRRPAGRAEPAPWVRASFARHQPEADLVVNLLRDAGIPAYHRRTIGFDVPDFFGFGAREVMVRADQLLDARELLDPFRFQQAPGADPGPNDPR